MHDMAMICNTPANRRIWHPNASSQVLQVPISVPREITLQEEHLCCQKIVICGFNGVLKCNDPRWSRMGGEGTTWELACIKGVFVSSFTPPNLTNTQ